MMKHACVGIIAFILCVTMMWTSTAIAAPKIEFEGGPSFDFGDVEPNTTLQHTFVFTNSGDAVLQIPQVKGG